MNPRFTAYQILVKLERHSSNSSLLLLDALKAYSNPMDRNLITDLVLGTTRWRGKFLYLIEKFSRTPVHQLDQEVLVILQMGLYQLLFTKTPTHAAIHETVNLCKQAKRTSASSFVNGILRTIQRNISHLPEPETSDPAIGLSIRWSHPEWVVRRWLSRFGEEQTKELLEFNMQVPFLYIRINPLVSTVKKTLERLEEEGVTVAPTEYGPYVYRILQGAPQLTKSFAQGDFYIQDPAIEMLTNQIQPVAETKILEVAAAPGGKTVQLAARMNDQGTIVSVDSDLNRMKLWQENMQRMKVRSASGIVADARDLPFTSLFDQIILDAPCSSLGVIRRHPEIKWWRRQEDLIQLSGLQLQILEACAKYVRDRGEIVYIVCSFEPEETVQMVDKFLAQNSSFQKIDESFLFPHQQKTDGFFLAKLRKNAS